LFNKWLVLVQHALLAYNREEMKQRTRSIRIPVTLAEQRAARGLAERHNLPLTQLVRKMLREAAEKMGKEAAH